MGWPYLAAPPANPALWLPPPNVGILHGRAGMMSSSALDQVMAALDQNHPVILLMMLSASFFRPDGDGIVTPMIGEVSEPARRHSVVACGHGRVDGSPALLVRNSWGPRWGHGGYAWLTEAFLKPRLFAAATLMENIDVPARSIAA